MSSRVPLHRPTILVVGLCLLAALLAGVALGTVPGDADGEPEPEVVTNSNTSNYLQPPAGDAVREGSAVQGVNVGTAVATDAESIAGHTERARFDRKIEAADNVTQRLRLARWEVDNLTARTDRIRSASQTARRSFRSESLSAQQFFYRTARLDASADRASDYREYLVSRITGLDATSQSTLTQLQILEPDLETLDGPVTDELRARYDGNITDGSTYVRVTGGDGYVMSTVARDRLYREAQVGADWERGGPDRFEESEGIGGLNAADRRVTELYPWAYTHQVGSPRTSGRFRPTTLWKFVLNHNHGELTTYLDGSTEDAFREVQSKPLDRLPQTWVRSSTANDLNVTVTGTSPTGALRVETTQAGTDVGVDSTVHIDGTLVGSTGADGHLWVVQPSGEFTVTATGPDSATVPVTVPDAAS